MNDDDQDGTLDYDEVELNLNPNDVSNKYTIIYQEIKAEDLSINEESEEFDISIKINASNNVEN